MKDMSKTLRLITLLMAGLLWMQGADAVQAKGVLGKLTPWKKAPAKTTPENPASPQATQVEPLKDLIPPDKDYLLLNCEPIRLRIVEMNSKFFAIRPIYQPYITMLKRRHHNCLVKFNTQEIEFIKAYDIKPKEPEMLPPLTIDPTQLSPQDLTPAPSPEKTPEAPKKD